jgi:hypothetical protein
VIPTVQLVDVYKRFRSTRALDGVSVHVEPGVTGLLGPNGAGKTTLLRIVATALAPNCLDSRGCLGGSRLDDSALIERPEQALVSPPVRRHSVPPGNSPELPSTDLPPGRFGAAPPSLRGDAAGDRDLVPKPGPPGKSRHCGPRLRC